MFVETSVVVVVVKSNKTKQSTNKVKCEAKHGTRAENEHHPSEILVQCESLCSKPHHHRHTTEGTSSECQWQIKHQTKCGAQCK